MTEQENRKMRAEMEALRGQIGMGGVPAREENMAAPSGETAKSFLMRQIGSLRREVEERHLAAVQLQALYNELPEQLSPQADAALWTFLSAIPKRY